MTPLQVAQKAWDRFEQDIRKMSRADYITACQELAATCEASAQAVQEDIDQGADEDS